MEEDLKIQINSKNGKIEKEKSNRKRLLLIGIVIIVIGIVCLVFIKGASQINELFGGFMLGFGLILLILGTLLTIYAFYKVMKIEY